MSPDPLTGMISIGKFGIGKSIISGVTSGVSSEVTSIAFKKFKKLVANDKKTGRYVAGINPIDSRDLFKDACERSGGEYHEYEIGNTKVMMCIFGKNVNKSKYIDEVIKFIKKEI